MTLFGIIAGVALLYVVMKVLFIMLIGPRKEDLEGLKDSVDNLKKAVDDI